MLPKKLTRELNRKIPKELTKRQKVAEQEFARHQRVHQPDEILMRKELKEIIFREIKNTQTGNAQTNERNQMILLDRFGFFDGKSKTFEELAEKYGVSRSRPGAIIGKFLKALRKNKAIRELAKEQGIYDPERIVRKLQEKKK